jgi:hypothetical protein
LGSIQNVGTKCRNKSAGYSTRFQESDLRTEAKRLINKSLSENTRAAYNNGLACFEMFRKEFSLAKLWPPSLSHVTQCIAYLSLNKKSHHTVSLYLSALNFECKLSQLEDFSNNFIIRKMLEGLRRSNKKKDTRLPISKELLSNLITVLPSVCASDYEAALFSAAFSVAFFGCLRVGEFTLSKQSQMHQVIGIENIKCITNSGVQQIDLVIPASKTDQYGNGCLVKISENKSYICPVRLLNKYLHVRPSFEGPLFCHYGGKLLSRYQFAAVLNKALNFIGID